MTTHYRTLTELIPAHWERGSITTRDNLNIVYYRTGGEQPPILLLHGLMANALSWLRVAQALEKDFDLIMPDLRGHGDSGRSGTNFNYDLLARDMVDLLDALNISKIQVVGHSMGAEVAALLAAKHPKLVDKLILEEPPLRTMPKPTENEQYNGWFKQWRDGLERMRAQTHSERMESALGVALFGKFAFEEQDYVPMVEGQIQFDTGFLPIIYDLEYQITNPELIAKIGAPLLLMVGNPKHYSASTPEGVETIMNAAKKGQVIHFEEQGHMLHLENLDDYIWHLWEFLNLA